MTADLSKIRIENQERGKEKIGRDILSIKIKKRDLGEKISIRQFNINIIPYI